VSELAANAWRPALGGESKPEHAHAGPTPPELWVYPRGAGTAEVVCGVFDPSGDTWPMAQPEPPGPLSARPPSASSWDEIDADDAGSGRGLTIVAALCDGAGCRRTRSRLAADPITGKVAWFAMKVPKPCRPPRVLRRPGRRGPLARLLNWRGIAAVSHSHRDPERSSLSTAGGLTVRCQHGTFEWPAAGTVRLRGFADLADVLEDIVWLHEEMRCTSRPG
jgi:hypothetical protein